MPRFPQRIQLAQRALQARIDAPGAGHEEPAARLEFADGRPVVLRYVFFAVQQRLIQVADDQPDHSSSSSPPLR